VTVQVLAEFIMQFTPSPTLTVNPGSEKDNSEPTTTPYGLESANVIESLPLLLFLGVILTIPLDIDYLFMGLKFKNRN
jgi:hypothetical protein